MSDVIARRWISLHNYMSIRFLIVHHVIYTFSLFLFLYYTKVKTIWNVGSYSFKCIIILFISFLRYPDTPELFYSLNQNRVIVPGEVHESYPGKNINRKDPNFSDRSSGQALQTEIGLIRAYTVVIPSVHFCRTAITGKDRLCLHQVQDGNCLIFDFLSNDSVVDAF